MIMILALSWTATSFAPLREYICTFHGTFWGCPTYQLLFTRTKPGSVAAKILWCKPPTATVKHIGKDLMDNDRGHLQGIFTYAFPGLAHASRNQQTSLLFFSPASRALRPHCRDIPVRDIITEVKAPPLHGRPLIIIINKPVSTFYFCHTDGSSE